MSPKEVFSSEIWKAQALKGKKTHHNTTYKFLKSGNFLLHICKYSHPVYNTDIAQVFKSIPDSSEGQHPDYTSSSLRPKCIKF